MVHLSTQGDRIFGLMGDQRTDLRFEPLPGGVRIEGVFAGEGGALAMTPERIVGRIGLCVWDLWRRDPEALGYDGRAVDRNRTALLLAVPGQLRRQSTEEQAAYLTLFLMNLCEGSGSIRVVD